MHKNALEVTSQSRRWPEVSRWAWRSGVGSQRLAPVHPACRGSDAGSAASVFLSQGDGGGFCVKRG